MSFGRADRRRRLLNDGRLAAAEKETGVVDTDEQPERNATRFAVEANSTSLAIATRLLPTRAWPLTGALVAAIATTGALVTADLHRATIAASIGEDAARLLNAAEPRSLAAWVTATLSLVIVGLCGVVFGLRRRRSDDLRGVYRWWIAAALSATAISVCLTTGLHHVAASILASRVGWSPLPGDAFWWLAPAMATIGVVAIRVFLDLKESRLAAIAALMAAGCAAVALCASLGWAPAEAAAHLALIGVASTQAALTATALALLGYLRRITLEVAGHVAPPTKRLAADEPAEPAAADSAPASAQPKPRPSRTKKEPPANRRKTSTEPQPSEQEPATRLAAEAASTATEWVDGSQGGVDDGYDDDQPRRKLSKAERKRLRRQKARENRAA